MVWPALLPPWNRTTMSARFDSQSTILPLPSSPHWAPITVTLAKAAPFRMRRGFGPDRREGQPLEPRAGRDRSAPDLPHQPHARVVQALVLAVVEDLTVG